MLLDGKIQGYQYSRSNLYFWSPDPIHPHTPSYSGYDDIMVEVDVMISCGTWCAGTSIVCLNHGECGSRVFDLYLHSSKSVVLKLSPKFPAAQLLFCILLKESYYSHCKKEEPATCNSVPRSNGWLSPW